MRAQNHADIIIFRAENGWAACVSAGAGLVGRNFVAHDLEEMGRILAEAMKPAASPLQSTKKD